MIEGGIVLPTKHDGPACGAEPGHLPNARCGEPVGHHPRTPHFAVDGYGPGVPCIWTVFTADELRAAGWRG